jgi:hypothetical protein
MGVVAPAPGGRRVRQFQLIPLGFLTRRMVDHRDRAALRGTARFQRRAQPPGPDLPGQGRIRQGKTQWLQLIEQRDRPQMRVLFQPGGHIVNERGERVRLRRSPFTGGAITSQIIADGLSVTTQMPGDRRDRPALAGQRMRVHVFLPCEHGRQGSFELASGQRPPASKEPHLSRGATRVGILSEQKWGVSTERRHHSRSWRRRLLTVRRVTCHIWTMACGRSSHTITSAAAASFART